MLILNYGLTLEHLEDFFYADGLRKYSAEAFAAAGYPAWVRQRISEISYHERGHVKFVADTIVSLNGTAVQPWSVDFFRISLDRSLTFSIATARTSSRIRLPLLSSPLPRSLRVSECRVSFRSSSVFENKVLSLSSSYLLLSFAAYLGAAEYIVNKGVLTAAGSILGVEARHAAWIRSAAQPGNAFPQQYDTPLDFNPVFSLASAFITACPATNPALPFKAFPALTLTGTAPLKNLDTVTLRYEGSTSAQGAFAMFVLRCFLYRLSLTFRF